MRLLRLSLRPHRHPGAVVIAAILAAGPSLDATWPHAGPFDVVLAVNCAAVDYACDWWVAGDPESFDWFVPVEPPRRGVVTDALNYRRATWWPACGGQVARWCEFRAPFGSGQWHTSGPAAVGFAAMVLGASEVHCYGMEMAGDRDRNGMEACSLGGAGERWRVESRELAAIVAATGVRLVRHLADGTAAVVAPPPPEPPRNATRCGWCGRPTMVATATGRRCSRCGHRTA